MINVVNIGDKTTMYSGPLITFNETIKTPHQSTISPK